MFDKQAPKYIFKISIIASKNVGKKTLVRDYACIFDAKIAITHGIEFATLDLMVFGRFIRNSLWIYSNEERYRKLFPYYISGSNGIILMYDITKMESLNYLSEMCRLIKNYIKKDIPILLVGNKIDLKEKRKVMRDYIEKFKENYDISSSTEISLKTGENVEKFFIDISKMMIKHFNLT